MYVFYNCMKRKSQEIQVSFNLEESFFQYLSILKIKWDPESSLIYQNMKEV